MADNGMRGRVKGLLAGPPHAALEPQAPPEPPMEAKPAPVAQREALQVLTLAQRTAEEHLASAHRQADKIHADAQAAADDIVRDAEGHARDIRDEAADTLDEARATAERLAREINAQAEAARREAEAIVADARAQAELVGKDAQAKADELKHQAELRYQDVVGSLIAKREGLQQQIEALEQFDRDYRTRLQSFMQGQLRALWVDEPRAGDPHDADLAPLIPAQRAE